MPYEPIGYSDDDLMAQQAALARRKAILQQQARLAAQQQGVFAQPDTPGVAPGTAFTLSTGQHIPGRVMGGGGAQVLSALAPLVAQYRNERESSAYDRAESDYSRAEAAAAQRAMTEMPRTRTEPGPYGVDVTVEPTREERLAWAQRAGRIPSLRGTADAYMSDVLIKEPEREEARAFRRAEAQAQRAEAQRKQADELAYRRQRDAESADLRRELSAAVRSSRGGGGGGGGSAAPAGITLTDDQGNEVPGWARKNVKASEIVKDVDASGNVTLTDKLTGQRLRVGGGGRTSGQFDKDQQETRDQIEQSQKALSDAPHVDKLLTEASGSGLSADIRRAAGYLGGYSDKSSQADKALNSAAAFYTRTVPRFSGPTSDADRKDYERAAGDLANTNTAPEDRRAALREVTRLHKKSLEQMRARGTFAGDTNARRQDNNSHLSKLPGGGGGRSLTFNPATGKLE